MVHIITGRQNHGKTNKILSIYEKLKKGDGFITRKLFRYHCFIGYEIVRLQTRESIPFAYKREYTPHDWDEIYKYGSFTFSKKALRFAEKIITESINKGVSPVFIDEIGPLELDGKGFSNILREVLDKGENVYLTVRHDCVDKVTQKFSLKKHEVIRLNL